MLETQRGDALFSPSSRAHRLARPEEMFVGVGSDEALDLVIRCFCRPGGGEAGDRIVVCPPTCWSLALFLRTRGCIATHPHFHPHLHPHP